MRIIEINVNKQIQEIVTDNNNLIENSANYIKLHFNFDEDWNGFNTKYVIFKHKSNKVKSLIDEDGCCVVPYSVIQTPNFSFSVLSENDTQRLTTNILYIEVGKTISVDSVKDEQELELLYKQLETLVTLENNEIEELKEMINNLGDNISVDVDLSEINAKLDDLSASVGQILNVVNYNKTTLNNINSNVNSVGNLLGVVNGKTDTTKENTDTIISQTDTIINLLTDTNTLLTDANATVNNILG